MTDLVETHFKEPRKRSPQQQRRTQWQKDYEAAQVVVGARSKGWCEVRSCDHQGDQFHHRRGRRVPDANDPVNVIHVCAPCHLRIEEGDRAWAYREGYLLERTS